MTLAKLNGFPAIIFWSVAFLLAPAVVPSLAFFSCACGQAPEASEAARSVPDATRPRPTEVTRPAVIEFHGEINGKLTTYFKNRFAKAKKAGVDLLIIEIDSPGGLKTESLEMARMLRDCDWAYTIAVINNEAISGGALVSLGCDEIQIDPNAKYGDSGEIGFDSEQWAWRLIEPKIESYLSRDARDLAESKGRPPDLAEAMVDKDLLVYRLPPEGEVAAKFKSVRVDEVIKPDAPWVLVEESKAERFLTLSGQRTVELGMGQGSLSTRAAIANEFQFDLKELRVHRLTTTDTAVHFLNLPLITGLLVLVGLVAFYFEMSAPGLGIGGLISVLCALLFFWSKFLGGTSGWLEVILFLAGVIFIFTEVFIIPGFGVPGIAGLALVLCSAVLASQEFVIPQTTAQWNQTLTSLLVLLGTGVGFLTCAVLISKKMGSLPIFNRMVLAPPPLRDDNSAEQKEGKNGKPAPAEHPTVSVGDWGHAESLLRPAGRARFAGRSFDVISDGSFVDAGTQVRVVKIQGTVITVAEIDEPAAG